MNQEIGVQEQYVYETASPWRNRGQSQLYLRRLLPIWSFWISERPVRDPVAGGAASTVYGL